jgi:hypothetical protein
MNTNRWRSELFHGAVTGSERRTKNLILSIVHQRNRYYQDSGSNEQSSSRCAKILMLLKSLRYAVSRLVRSGIIGANCFAI